MKSVYVDFEERVQVSVGSAWGPSDTNVGATFPYFINHRASVCRVEDDFLKIDTESVTPSEYALGKTLTR